jgi:SAM-dependent methyltransferase
MVFDESVCAHKWIDPLCDIVGARGIEIGGSAHNPFTFPNKQNVDYTDSMDTQAKREEIRLSGGALPVDIVAFADKLPFQELTLSYLIACHVFEHLPNPIKALREWYRVLLPGAIVYLVIPFRTVSEADKAHPVTSIGHIVNDYVRNADTETHPILPGHGKFGHYHTFTMQSFGCLLVLFNEIMYDDTGNHAFEAVEILETCDKVPNGFVYVLRRI